MTPEEKALLENTYNLAKENNELLRALRRTSRWSLAWKIGYWAVIILLSFGALYFIQPYVQILEGLAGHPTGGTNSTSQQIQDLLR